MTFNCSYTNEYANKLQAHQTIYALYAHKRLHSEIEELAPKAVITTEDDIHLTMTFDNQHVVKVTVPAIYPNVCCLSSCDYYLQNFGMIQIDSVDSPKKEKLEVSDDCVALQIVCIKGRILWRSD